RARLTGVRDRQHPGFVVPDGVDKGNKLPFDAAISKREVDGAQHFGGGRLDGRVRTQDAAHQGCIDSRWSAFAADIADYDSQTGQGIMNEVIEIAANGAGG